jgi:hypothetical protein
MVVVVATIISRSVSCQVFCLVARSEPSSEPATAMIEFWDKPRYFDPPVATSNGLMLLIP